MGCHHDLEGILWTWSEMNWLSKQEHNQRFLYKVQMCLVLIQLDSELSEISEVTVAQSVGQINVSTSIMLMGMVKRHSLLLRHDY